MDFGLRRDWQKPMPAEFNPWDVGRFAGDHNTTAKRFDSLVDSRHAEAVGAMAEDWSEGVSYILPEFQMAGRILDEVERDNAEVVITDPAWPH
jgi:hypothetical protein